MIIHLDLKTFLLHKSIRDVDEIHLIDSSGNQLVTTNTKKQDFIPPNEKALEMV